uniref:protein kinase C-binding protein NELL2-like isoform X1 n=1 Tax=Myxine glutinosa TaxID=7769 RepID=UPI0035902D36
MTLAMLVLLSIFDSSQGHSHPEDALISSSAGDKVQQVSAQTSCCISLDLPWVQGCLRCSCTAEQTICEPLQCLRYECSSMYMFTYMDGECCKQCRPYCYLDGQTYLENETIATWLGGTCVVQKCQVDFGNDPPTGQMETLPAEHCPPVDCKSSEQYTLSNSCCTFCPGHDFCASESFLCKQNSFCTNTHDGARCKCLSGYTPLREDSVFCQGGLQSRCRNISEMIKRNGTHLS